MGLAFSASITVTSPSGGTWYKGTTHNITWTATGCSSTTYKINIFRGSIDPANFVEQLTKSGTPSKSWTVPMGYTNGTYYIRIKTDPAQTGCVGDSAAFTITDGGGGAPAITVTSPTGASQWCRGETKNITWTSSGSLDSNVKINIFKGSIDPANFVTQLTATTASGSKGWAIPGSATVGTYYVRVKEASGTVTGDSPGFQVKDCGSSPSGSSCSKFIITKPEKGSIYWKGFPIEIKWKKKIQILPGTIQAKRVLQKVPERMIKPELDMSKLKLVKIEIKSVKCMTVAQMIPKLKVMYAQKQLSTDKIKMMMEIPWVVELLKWKTIAAMTPDDGSFTWNGSGTFKKGCYVIRITKLWCDASDSDRVATSGKFSIIPIQFPEWFKKKAVVLKEKTD